MVLMRKYPIAFHIFALAWIQLPVVTVPCDVIQLIHPQAIYKKQNIRNLQILLLKSYLSAQAQLISQAHQLASKIIIIGQYCFQKQINSAIEKQPIKNDDLWDNQDDIQFYISIGDNNIPGINLMQTVAPEINADAASVLTQDPFTFSISTICLICLCAIATTSLSELLGWLITYRKESYKQTKSDIERLNKKLEKLKNTHVIQIQSKAHEKKIAAVQGQLKQISQGMTFDTMKSNIPTGILMIGALYVIGTIFGGTVVGYLPFEPHWIIQKITHRNLAGEDYTECSYLFIYILFAFIWRSNLKKLLGFEAPKPAVSFFEPPKMKPE